MNRWRGECGGAPTGTRVEQCCGRSDICKGIVINVYDIAVAVYRRSRRRLYARRATASVCMYTMEITQYGNKKVDSHKWDSLSACADRLRDDRPRFDSPRSADLSLFPFAKYTRNFHQTSFFILRNVPFDPDRADRNRNRVSIYNILRAATYRGPKVRLVLFVRPSSASGSRPSRDVVR
ncbi:unnamed protein product [Pieris brassicae]|uniref:Uncharacterized protein n=1 Tax=Pieris brassicae TaxID=7116 RepID=A0A9P0TNA2_PIEBR|nr:unnamed protein product [Pieris brassicae]